MPLDHAKPFRQIDFRDLPPLPRRPHPFNSAPQTFVDVPTAACGIVRTSVRTWGEGPPLLLLHGLMTTAYSWRYVLEPLGEKFTLWIPDLPGAGESSASATGNYQPEALGQWIAALQRSLDIRGCDVIGNSMAGFLGMRLALDDPGAIGRLVNIHSPAFPEARLRLLDAALRIPFAKAGLSAYIAGNPRKFAHRQVHYYDETLKSLEEAEAYSAPLRHVAGRRAFIEQLHQTMGPGGLRRFEHALRARHAAGDGFPVPMLLVYARQDPLVDPRIGDKLRILTGATLVDIAHGSHFAHVDAVHELLPHVSEFLVIG